MCGIVGGTHIQPPRLEYALETIAHRGPDARGIWRDRTGEVSLGHVRLAIIDLDPRANQPMVCPRTGNVITFNGEIYNFRSIRRELEQLGWEFRTRSDTEVLLASYGQWGVDCLSRLNGMFAFAVHDPSRRQILLVRDRVGKKPLYFSLYGEHLTFASELKALLAIRPGIPRTINEEALHEYMGLGYIPGSLSIYREAQKLKPGHYAVFDLDSKAFRSVRYWSLPPPWPGEMDEEEAAEELEPLLVDAVKLRLESDVPVGLFLSGGLDSSLITAIAAREKPSIAALTISFPLAKYDESAMAKQVANWTGTAHHILPVDFSGWDLLDPLAHQFDEPFADSSLLPTFVLSKAVRQHVTVALSGDGGDELFAGYEYYALTLKEAYFERIPRFLRTLLSVAQTLVPLGTMGKNWLRRLPYSGVDHFMRTSFAPEEQPISLLQESLQKRLEAFGDDLHRSAVMQWMLEQQSEDTLSLLQRMTRLDFYSYLPDDILVKVDRASMLCSLEVRSPLLDYRVVELAFRLPDRLRMNGNIRKYLLKRIGRKYLPKDFQFERKQGFSIPEAEWFGGPWYDHVVNDPCDCNLLDPISIRRIADVHRRTGRCGRTLFKAIMLNKWQQQYLNGKQGK